MKKRFFIIFTAISILVSGVFVAPQPSQALFGFGDVVIDPTHIATTIASWAQEFANHIADYALKAALSALKKRLLDSIVDQTINWINGGGNPKFLTNMGDLVKDSVQGAVGDTLQEIGLGKVCQNFSSALQTQIRLQTPGRFSQRASCTLDQVVGNVQDFYNDFSKGGWLAYNELIKPQNNYFGALVMAQDEITARQEATQHAREQELQQGQGFTPTKACLEWTLYAYNTGTGQFEEKAVKGVGNDFNYPDPNNPPGQNEAAENGVDSNYTSPTWQCTKDTITTPGQVLRGATDKAVNAHTDYIVNTDDLQGYINALVDAGLNRLVKEGVKGIRGVLTSSNNLPSQGYFNGTNTPTNVGNAGNGYTNASGQVITNAKQALLRNLNTISTSLTNARRDFGIASNLVQQLASSTQNFIAWCNANGGAGVHPQSCGPLPALFISVTASSTAINAGLAQTNTDILAVQSLRTQINALNAGSAGTVGAISQTVIDLVNESLDLEGQSKDLPSGLTNQLSQMQQSYANCTTPVFGLSCP